MPVAVAAGVAGVVAARKTSGTTPFAAVEPGVGVPLAPVAVPDAAGVVAVPVGVPLEGAVGAVAGGATVVGRLPAASTKTARKLSWEGLRIAWSCSGVGVPGMATTMFCPPRVEISASATPFASMRWRMMSTAWSI